MTKDGRHTERLLGIDILRGVAVLAVIASHLPFSNRGLGAASGASPIYPPQPFPAIADYGRLGVQLFLLISGFCIHLRWATSADPLLHVEFLPFWRRRLARLYPPYILTVLAALGATFALNWIQPTRNVGLGAAFGYESTSTFVVDMLLLVFMLQNLTPAAWRIGNGPLWSLALEEQLYLLYFPLLWMRRNWGWTTTFIVSGLATFAWRAFGAFAFDSPPFFWFIVGPAFWLPWALGAYVAEVHHGHQAIPRWATHLAMFFGLFAVGILLDLPQELGFDQPRIGRMIDDIFYSGGFFVLLATVVRLESEGRLTIGPINRALAAVGTWSYGVYLIHQLAMVPAKQLLVHIGTPNVVVLFARFVVALLVGYVFYRLVEVPFHRFARRFRASLIRVPRQTD